MDSQTLAVVLTFTIDFGIAIAIFLIFFVYRKCRGDKFKTVQSYNQYDLFHDGFRDLNIIKDVEPILEESDESDRFQRNLDLL